MRWLPGRAKAFPRATATYGRQLKKDLDCKWKKKAHSSKLEKIATKSLWSRQSICKNSKLTSFETILGSNKNISRPDMPTVNPSFIFFFLLSLSFFSWSAFSLNFLFFHATKVWRLTGVSDLFWALNSLRFCSISSSILVSSFFSSFFLS